MTHKVTNFRPHAHGVYEKKLERVGPVDNRPSTAEAPPIGKINIFSKIAVTLEPVVPF